MAYRILDDPAGVIETDTVEELMMVLGLMRGASFVRCCSGPTGNEEIGCLHQIHGASLWPPSAMGRYPAPMPIRLTCTAWTTP